MEVYSTEDQQIDEIKGWFKENGKSAITIAILAVVAVGGWQYYKSSTKSSNEESSLAYTQALTRFDGKVANAKSMTQFIQSHDSSEYAIIAASELAKVYVDSDQIDQAIEQLVWAEKNAKDKMFLPLIRTRLARLYAEQKNYTQAVAMLDKVTQKAWLGRVAELKGDVLLAQGKKTQARSEYIQAQQLGVVGSIQTKINNLPK